MSSSENSDIDEITEKLHQVHLERHRLHEKEQALIRQLTEARKRRHSQRRRGRHGMKTDDREVDARIFGVNTKQATQEVHQASNTGS